MSVGDTDSSPPATAVHLVFSDSSPPVEVGETSIILLNSCNPIGTLFRSLLRSRPQGMYYGVPLGILNGTGQLHLGIVQSAGFRYGICFQIKYLKSHDYFSMS